MHYPCHFLATRRGAFGGQNGTLAAADALPYLLFSATFGKGELEDVQTMTHLALITIDCPDGIGQAEQLKARVAQLPYTLLAFTGSSQKTVKVVAECRYGDGTRRYLCCKVTDVIDTETPINCQRLYAQAMHELSAGDIYAVDVTF